MTRTPSTGVTRMSRRRLRRLFFQDSMRLGPGELILLLTLGASLAFIVSLFPLIGSRPEFHRLQAIVIGFVGVGLAVPMAQRHDRHLAGVHPALPVSRATLSQAAATAVTLQAAVALALGSVLASVTSLVSLPVALSPTSPIDTTLILTGFLGANWALLVRRTASEEAATGPAGLIPIWIAIGALHVLPAWATPLCILVLGGLRYRAEGSPKPVIQAMMIWLMLLNLDISVMTIALPIAYVTPLMPSSWLVDLGPTRLLEGLTGVRRILAASLVLSPLAILFFIGIFWLLTGRIGDSDFLPIVVAGLVLGAGDARPRYSTAPHDQLQPQWSTLLPRSKGRVLSHRALELTLFLAVGALCPLALGKGGLAIAASVAVVLVCGLLYLGLWSRYSTAPFTGSPISSGVVAGAIVLGITAMGFLFAVDEPSLFGPGLAVATTGLVGSVLFALTGLGRWWRLTPG